MSRTLRVLIAAFITVLASLAGALYVDKEHAGDDGQTAFFNDPVAGVASLDLRSLLADPRAADQRELDSAFRQVERAYYKPVTAQFLIDGERRELVDFLKKRNVKTPAIPIHVATGDEGADLTILNDDLRTAQTLYAKEASGSELTQVAIRGMLDGLGDPYTTYLSPREINELEDSLRGGDFGGIGVYIVPDPRTHQILVEPIEGTPAYRAGIKTGDEIVAVDGAPVSTLSFDEVERRIRGRIGTVVHLVIRSRKEAGEHELAVTRDQIRVPSVHAKVEDGFEYVRLADFGQTSYDEVRKAMLDGKSKGVHGYILDLRDNGGGLLDAAVDISSLFIPEGSIVSTIDRAGTKETRFANRDAIGATPLVVLVNKYTASASEITAGAIQDFKVGTLIGTKTFGKGVVQSIYNMSDGGALKITTARYVTPLGRDIHHKGIQPDIVVEQPIGPIIDTSKDVQLAAAKSYLRRITGR